MLRLSHQCQFDADHRLVVAKVRLTAPPKKLRREYRKFNVEKLNNKAVVEHLQTRISEKIERTEPSDEVVEQNWKSFIKNLKEAAEETIGVKRVYCGKKKTMAW